VRAVVFDLSIPKFALAKGLGRWAPGLYYGPVSCLKLREVAPPTLRGPAWARIQVDLAGVCGSDLALITFHYSTALEPFNSFPSVLGHEIFGRVVEAGPEAGVKEGDRVAIEPLLGCAVRGFDPPCARCAAGEPGLCGRVTDGDIGPGVMLGFCASLPGGWSETVVAHRSQLVKVPAAVPDQAAVMIEPLSVGVHAALKRPARAGEKVLVIGGGMISFAVLSALALLESPGETTHMALFAHQADLGKKLGAHRSITPGAGPLDDQVEAATGARRYKPIVGDTTFVGGYDVVYDCVGTQRSFGQALRYARPGGTVVLVGCLSQLARFDMTMVWAHELTVAGVYAYGTERAPTRRTFELTVERLASTKLPVGDIVTHRFELDDYREAIVANIERERYQSVKTVFDNRNRRVS